MRQRILTLVALLKAASSGDYADAFPGAPRKPLPFAVRSGDALFAAVERDAPSAVSNTEEAAHTGASVLKISSRNDPTRFDTGGVANPVIIPPSSVSGATTKWQCYYYGNPGSWTNGKMAFFPTGWTGLAESDDGIQWTKVVGPNEDGSILAPTGNMNDWDGVHLGVGDVIRVSDTELHMYYLGGSGESVNMLGFPFLPRVTGLRMRIGRARSSDGGRTWERMGLVLDYDKAEGLFASWPRLMIPDEEEKPWRMLYHAYNGSQWNVYGATSHDRGETWTRDGKLLGPGRAGTWDASGVGTRAIAYHQGRWIMVYEAVDDTGMIMGKHRLGVAYYSENDDGTYQWEKATEVGDEPGGPILAPGVNPLGKWTSLVIGTPYLVSMDDGSLRLYFCTRKNVFTNMSIGLVVSDTGDVGAGSWRTVSP